MRSKPGPLGRPPRMRAVRPTARWPARPRARAAPASQRQGVAATGGAARWPGHEAHAPAEAAPHPPFASRSRRARLRDRARMGVPARLPRGRLALDALAPTEREKPPHQIAHVASLAVANAVGLPSVVVTEKRAALRTCLAPYPVIEVALAASVDVPPHPRRYFFSPLVAEAEGLAIPTAVTMPYRLTQTGEVLGFPARGVCRNAQGLGIVRD
jgi:hypothetical protein